MNNSNLKNLLTEYEKKRLNSIYEAEKRKEDIYKKLPKLQEIDDTLSKEAIKASKMLIEQKDSSILSDLNNKISNLKNEKENILKQNGYTLDLLKPIYECNDCDDTGYISKNYIQRCAIV